MKDANSLGRYLDVVGPKNPKSVSTPNIEARFDSNFKSSVRYLSDKELHVELKSKIQKERELISEVISYISEVDQRRLYLRFSYTSLFDYLTKEFKYSAGSAQRRIQAARLLKEVPSLKNDLKTGELNLTQVSMMVQAVNQKSREVSLKSELNGSLNLNVTSTVEVQKESNSTVVDKVSLLNKIKGKSNYEAQGILSKELDLEIKLKEKETLQKDGSLSLSITLSETDSELLVKAKELVSHIDPKASSLDIIKLALKEFVQKRDVSLKGMRQRNVITSLSRKLTSTVEVKKPERSYISIAAKKNAHNKSNGCNWKDPSTGHTCGSKFQLQIDHIKPVWAGGSNEANNLQMLCSAHNRLKYFRETGRFLPIRG